jgi:predicted Zn-dependent protease
MRARSPLGLVILVLSALGLGADGAQPPEASPPKRAAKARRPAPAAKKARRNADEPPPCPHRQVARAQAPPATSMPEFFARMGERFATNPATAMQGALDEMAQLEEPAMRGIVLTPAEEREAGRRARAEFLAQAARRGYRTVDDPKRLAYLRDLVDAFAARMKNRDRYDTIDITLIDAPEADGQSFPGGFLVFSTGLLDEPDEATVAGVVAHELAHLDRGHLYGYARRSKLAQATFSNPPNMMGGPDDPGMTRALALFGLMMNPYRPEHEMEADCTAATWMFQEEYDPRALVGFFERLHARIKDQPPNPVMNFGRTHPFSLDRRREVLDRRAQLRRWRPRAELGLHPDNLRRLVARPRERAAE